MATPLMLLADDTSLSAATKSILTQDHSVRVALVTGVRSKDTLNAMALAEVRLSESDNVSLLERGEINKLLKEHKLALSGMSDPATAVHLGKILTVDLLAVLEGDPRTKKQQSMGLVVFDARTGVRLVDETLPTKSEQTAQIITETVHAAVIKYLAASNTQKTVSIATVRNIDLPMDKDSYCEAIGQLLERALVRSPDVMLLERRSLEHVRRERATSADAPSNALLASLEIIELEIARHGIDRLKATVILTSPEGKKRRIEVTTDENAATELVDKLLSGILDNLSVSASKHKLDREADALRMFHEASYESGIHNHDRAIVCIEACMALADLGPGVSWAASSFYRRRAAHVYNPNNIFRRRNEESSNSETYPLVAQTEESRKRVLVDAIRSVEYLTKGYEYKIAEGKFLEFHHYKMMRHPSFYGYSMANFIKSLRLSSGGWNDENKQLTTTLMSHYEHLMLDLLLPSYAKLWQKKKFSFSYLQPYVHIVANCWKYLPNSNRWTDVMVKHGHRIMKFSDRHGPVMTGCHNLKVTYVYPLSVIITFQKNPLWEVAPNDSARLKKLFTEMEHHRLQGIQGFGKLGHLWLEQQAGLLSKEQIQQRSEGIFDFACKAIEKPGIKKANLERMACYEVMCGIVNSIGMSNKYRGQLLDKLLDFMVGRKEAALNIINILSHRYSHNHANYYTGVCFIYLDTWPSLWMVHSYDRDLDKVARLTRKLQALLKKKKLCCLDGRTRQINIQLNKCLAEHAKYDARLKQKDTLSPDPWIKERCLIHFQDHPGLKAFSKPAVRGNMVYVAGFFPGNPNQVKLFQIPLGGQPGKAISHISLTPLPISPLNPRLPKGTPGSSIMWVTSGPGEQQLMDRALYPVKLAYSTDDTLYYTLPYYGGVVVFPLDGSSPRQMLQANTPGMPTDTIDYAAAIGNRLFAFTSSAKTNKRSYVHWYDPKGKGWQVLASSARVDNKTPLDGPQHFFDGYTYDASRERVLFLTSGCGTTGLHQFDVDSLELKKIKDMPKWRPMWYGRLPGDRLWFVFAWGPLDVKPSNIIQYNLRTNKWSEFVHRQHAPKPSLFVPGVKRSKQVLANDRGIEQPFTEIDGWIWSFHPLARVSIDGKTFQQFKERLVSKRLYMNHLTPDINTLEYLPERRGLLYGNHRSLWYFQLPHEADPPPSQKKSKKPGHSAKAKKEGSTK